MPVWLCVKYWYYLPFLLEIIWYSSEGMLTFFITLRLKTHFLLFSRIFVEAHCDFLSVRTSACDVADPFIFDAAPCHAARAAQKGRIHWTRTIGLFTWAKATLCYVMHVNDIVFRIDFPRRWWRRKTHGRIKALTKPPQIVLRLPIWTVQPTLQVATAQPGNVRALQMTATRNVQRITPT